MNTMPRRERGAALMVVLMLLLAMTLLGLASLRMTSMEEKMAAGMYDRSLAFQAAEAALREGEVVAQAGSGFPASGNACTSGLCRGLTQSGNGTEDRWKDSTFNSWRAATVDVGTVATSPQLIVEQMEEAPNWVGCDQVTPIEEGCLSMRYRITARSAAANRASVVLQTNYAAY